MRPVVDHGRQAADVEAASQGDGPDDEAARTERLSITSTPPTAPLALKAAWGASVAALALLVVGTVVWRDSVVRLWPPSQHVLGVPAVAASVRPSQ